MSDPNLPPGTYECPKCGYMGLTRFHLCGAYCDKCGIKLRKNEEDEGVCVECAKEE